MARFLWIIDKIDRGASSPLITCGKFSQVVEICPFKLQWHFLQWFHILVAYEVLTFKRESEHSVPECLF